MIQFPLRLIRISCGYSVEEAAKYFGVDTSTMDQYEKDTSLIPIRIIRNIRNIPLELIYIGPENECAKHNRENIRLNIN